MRTYITTKGFTVVEIIAAVAIIGIISAVATTQYSGYRAKARLNTGTHVALDLLLAAQNYAITNNIFTQVCWIDNDDGQNARAMITVHPTEADLTGDGTLIGQDPTDGGTYPVIKEVVFDSGVTFCQEEGGSFCSLYTNWKSTKNCTIFNNRGHLNGSPGYQPAAVDINPSNEHHQASLCFLSDSISDKSQSAREIEITASGQITLVGRGQSGDLVSVSGNEDNTPTLSAGSGACSYDNLTARSRDHAGE